MAPCLLLLHGRPPAEASAAAHCLHETARAVGVPIVACGTLQAALDALDPPCPVAAVLLDPDVERPFAAARRLAQKQSDLRFVFTAEATREAALRREAMFSAPPGGRWSLLAADDPRLQRTIVAELDAHRQQRRLRTTLDRMKLRLAAPAPVDASEYRRLVVSDRYLATVLAHANDGIVSVDRRGRVVAWNRGAERLFGLSAQQAQQRALASLFDDAENVERALAEAMAGQARSGEFTFSREGAIRHVEATFDAIADDDGAASGVAAILRDSTERHRVEEELRNSARQKDEFLAMLAHELRNPLAPIRNAAQWLNLVGPADPASREATAVILRQVTHMAGLIDDLLDVARVTRGSIALQWETLPVAIVVGDAVEQARVPIESKGHRFTVTQSSPALRVRGDRKRLTQILSNLLLNSAKYTPNGGHIRLDVSADANEVVLAVSDDGIGIAPTLLPKVFDLFVQAERSPDRSEGGLGIGLALVKSLTAAHGGSVSAFSEGTGRGARFEVRLPRVAQEEAMPSDDLDTLARTRDERTPLRLMVVDDNEDAARTLALLLRTLGHEVEVEIDPRAALDRTQDAMPDAFILDIGMPGIDGYELARRLRAQSAGKRTALIALTGYGQASDRERAQRAGFDHLMVKPPDAVALSRILDTLTGRVTH